MTNREFPGMPPFLPSPGRLALLTLLAAASAFLAAGHWAHLAHFLPPVVLLLLVAGMPFLAPPGAGGGDPPEKGGAPRRGGGGEHPRP